MHLSIHMRCYLPFSFRSSQYIVLLKTLLNVKNYHLSYLQIRLDMSQIDLEHLNMLHYAVFP